MTITNESLSTLNRIVLPLFISISVRKGTERELYIVSSDIFLFLLTPQNMIDKVRCPGRFAFSFFFPS